MKKNNKIEVIGGKADYVEIFIEDDFQVVKTEEGVKIIEENLTLINSLEQKSY